MPATNILDSSAAASKRIRLLLGMTDNRGVPGKLCWFAMVRRNGCDTESWLLKVFLSLSAFVHCLLPVLPSALSTADREANQLTLATIALGHLEQTLAALRWETNSKAWSRFAVHSGPPENKPSRKKLPLAFLPQPGLAQTYSVRFVSLRYSWTMNFIVLPFPFDCLPDCQDATVFSRAYFYLFTLPGKLLSLSESAKANSVWFIFLAKQVIVTSKPKLVALLQLSESPICVMFHCLYPFKVCC